MISFKINFEVMRGLAAQQNKNFRGWYETQRKGTNLVKIDGYYHNAFDKVGNITTTS